MTRNITGIEAWKLEEAAEIDDAFAQTFGMICNLATMNALDQARKVIFSLCVRWITVRYRSKADWYYVEVDSRFDRENYKSGKTVHCGALGVGGHATSETCALMIAAIEWDCAKRRKRRTKDRERRARRRVESA